MAIKVVGFTDIIHYDGNEPIFIGRSLLGEYSDTEQYKKLKPGDFEISSNRFSKSRWDFVAATPFDADLVINEQHYFAGPTVTLYCEKNNTYYAMFISDLIEMASDTVIDHGKVSGRFGYVKRNKNFGITYLGEAVGD